MNDDIVTRLRMSADLADGFPKALAKNLFPISWVYEAADEIERLRSVLKIAETVLLGGLDVADDYEDEEPF